EGESQSGPRRHERHQGPVERTLAMDFVEGLGLREAELDETGRADNEPRGLEVREDLSCKASLDRVGLDDGECEHERQVSGGRGWASGGNETPNDVGARQESYHHPLTNYREAVDVPGAHQVGDVGKRLVFRQ